MTWRREPLFTSGARLPLLDGASGFVAYNVCRKIGSVPLETTVTSPFQASSNIFKDARAVSRLHQLGLAPEPVLDALAFMGASDATYTAHDPAAARGMNRWGRLHRAFRDGLADAGWTPLYVDGMELTVGPGGEVGVAVYRGDGNVLTDRTPSTRKGLGPMSRRIVERNRQPSFQATGSDFQWVDERLPRLIYVLLFFIDRQVGEVCAELSLPAGITQDGRIREWDERIFVGSVPYQEAPGLNAGDETDDDEDEDDGQWVTPRESAS